MYICACKYPHYVRYAHMHARIYYARMYAYV